MGLSASAVNALILEHKRRPFNGSLLSFGKQDIFFTKPELTKIFEKHEIKIARESIPILSLKKSEAEQGYISDNYLYGALGFSEHMNCDASDYEGADLIFDLNSSNTPQHLTQKFNVVLDSGTIEHIFHIPNVLANIFNFLDVGGRIIHMSPSSNHIDHGFYMFSPTFFWDYYIANRFEINVCQVFRYDENWKTEGWEFSNYIPGCLTSKSIGGLDDGIFGIYFVATKTKESTYGIIPQQGMYTEGRWKGNLSIQSISEELIRVNEKIIKSSEGVITGDYQRGTNLPMKYKL